MGLSQVVAYVVFFACAGAEDDSFVRIGAALRNKTTRVNNFLTAVDEGHAAEVTRLLHVDPQLIRFRDRQAATILMKASNLSDAGKSKEMVRLLLDAGAQATIGAIDHESKTALMYAAQHGHLSTVALLLERPTSAASAGTVKDATHEVNSVLTEIKSGHLANSINDDGAGSTLVKKLQNRGAFTGANAAGETALMKVSALEDEEKSLKATELLLQLGAQAVINVVDYKGKSALHHAAENRKFKTCQLLIDRLGSLGPKVALLPPKDIFQVTDLAELNRTNLRCKQESIPVVCKKGRFFCFDPELFDERFGELNRGSGETRFRGFANGRSGWIRVFHSREDCGCLSCGRWDNVSIATEGDWKIGDVILHQATNYWPAGSRVRIVKGSRYSHHHEDEETCATLTSNLYEGAGYQEVRFDDGINYKYEFEDLDPCSEVMPFDVATGECTTDADHCVISPNYPMDYSNSSECSIRIKTPAMLRAVSFQAEEEDNLYWQLQAPVHATAKHVWRGAQSLSDAEATDENHSILHPGQKFKPFETSVHVSPWLYWSSDVRGSNKGWRICESLIDWRDINNETAAMKAIDVRSKHGLEVLEHLLKSNANVEGGNKTGQTALMKACEQPNEGLASQAVQLLFRESDARRTLHAVDNKNRTALMYAVMQCSISVVRRLLDEAKDSTKLANHVDEDGKGALLHAVEHCSVQMVEALVDALGGKSEAAAEMQVDAAGKTTIMYAAQRPNVEMLAYLINLYGGEVPRILTSGGKVVSLKMYADFVKRRDNESKSALSYAAKYGHLEAIQLLKDHGANMSETSSHGKTVLMYAVESGNVTTVKHLLESKDMKQLLDKRDTHNRTALMYAANFSDNTTKILLKKGANISAKDASDMSVLMYAAQGGKASVVKTILEIVDPVQEEKRALGYGKQLARMLADASIASPADMINWTDKEGSTALIYASQVNPRDSDTDSIGVIDLLVNHRADVGRSNSCLVSPLMAAAQRGYLLTVRALLDACHNDTTVMNARNGGWGRKPLESCDSPTWGMPWVWGQWRTALWLAAERGHLSVVKELTGRSADFLLRDRQRMLPIEVARKSGHVAVTQHLQLKNPHLTDQVTRTWQFKDFYWCLGGAVICSVVFVVLYVSVLGAAHAWCRLAPGGDASESGEHSDTLLPRANGQEMHASSPGAAGAAATGPEGADAAGAEGSNADQDAPEPDRGSILLAARAVRFRQEDERLRQEDERLRQEEEEPKASCFPCCRGTRSTSSRKLTYALNVCANVLMPFGPLMYFTNPDFVVMWWFALYFVLPIICSVGKASEGASFHERGQCVHRCCQVLLKLWQAPSLAMTGKYLWYPWITRWLRPRLLIFLVTFTELLMRICGRPISRPSSVLVFDHAAPFWPGAAIKVDTFWLYTAFLIVISTGAVLWRTGIIPLFADMLTLLWVIFGTQLVTHSQMKAPFAVAISLLMPSYPLCLYMVHIYMEGQKHKKKVYRKWWDDDFSQYEQELQTDEQPKDNAPAQKDELSAKFDRIMELARKIKSYDNERKKSESKKSKKLEELEQHLKREKVELWHCAGCDRNKDFGVVERSIFFALDMWFDFQTIVLLLLADRFYFAGVMLFVCFSSSFLHFLLWVTRKKKNHQDKSWSSWCCSCFFSNGLKEWDKLRRGVPTVAFLKWTDRAHGFQDFFSLCVTLRSLPLIGKQPLVMVLQMVSIAMSTWGLTTFLFEKIELEVTNLYYDSSSVHC